MASNYPGSLDSFDTIASDKKTSDAVGGRTHRAMHNDLGDAIESVQTELGTNPSGSDATVAARLTAIEAGTNLATGAVTSAKIADGTIATGDIADGAVTYAKLGSDVRIGNLLTANQATGYADATFASNCTRTNNTFTASTTASSMSAGYRVNGITAGAIYSMEVNATTSGINSIAGISWRNASDSQITYSLAPGTVTAGTTGTLRQTVTAPAGAVSCIVYVVDGGPVTAGVTAVTLNRVGFWLGAAGVWSLPGLPVVGQSAIAVNDAVHLSGTGSPEGVVTAAPGSTWLQTDATTDVKGWIRWVKATGTGNTGWQAGAEADTGWRSFSGSLLNGWGFYDASRLVIRRVGESVTVHVGDLNHTSATAGQIWTVPSGFRPKWNLSFPNYTNGDATSDTAIRLFAGTGELTYMGTRASVENAGITFLTSNAWPTSLPGSAA